MNNLLSNWSKRYLSHPEAVALLLILGAALIILKIFGYILAPIIIGATLAYLLSNIVKKLEKLHLPHLLSASLVFLLFISLLLLLFLWLLPILWHEMAELVAEIPPALNYSKGWLLKFQHKFPDFISANQVNQIISYMATYIASLGKEIVSFSLSSLINIATLIIYLILVPLSIFFFLRDDIKIKTWAVKFLPENKNILKKIWNELHEKVGNYIRGRIIEIIIVAFSAITVFLFLKLQYAILLGALVGLSVLVPYVGAIIVIAPLIIVGLLQWGWSLQFFYLILSYTIINLLDANILVPLLFSEVMDLHPLAIILAVLIFGCLFGFWGIFFAIPLMALTNIILKHWPKTH